MPMTHGSSTSAGPIREALGEMRVSCLTGARRYSGGTDVSSITIAECDDRNTIERRRAIAVSDG